MKIMRFCLPALLAALGLTSLLSQPVGAGQVITLERALEISLQKNPTLSASRSSVDAYKGKVTQAESAYYPQVSGSVGYNRTYQDSSSVSSGASTWDNGYSAGLSLSQYLYDFGKTNGLVEQSHQNLAASQHGYYSAASQLVRDVKSSYFDVLEGQHLLEVNQEYLDSQQRHLDQAKALYTQGLRPKIDVLTAETETSQARLSLVQAKYALRKYRTNLEKYLGGPPPRVNMP